MVREPGVVERIISQNLAEVRLQRVSACKNCQACAAANSGSRNFLILAINEIGSKENEVVLVDIPPAEAISASVFVFVTPIILIFIGYGTGQLIGRWFFSPVGANYLSGLLIVLFLSLYLGVLALFDKFIRLNQRISARIIEKVTEL